MNERKKERVKDWNVVKGKKETRTKKNKDGRK